MVNSWKEDLEWYETHQTESQIGFDPDGMCLKVCRTSRDVGSKYLTAAECRDATPKEFRHYKVRDLRKGMKLYFGDPNDSNTADHIVTMIGRVKGFDWDDLNDVLVETNSVKSGELVVVRGTYFKQHWNDDFQFGANWINGVELDYAGQKKIEKPKQPEPAPGHRVDKFRQSGNKWDVKFLDRSKRPDLLAKVGDIENLVEYLPDEGDSLVSDFKKTFEEDRVLDMHLLNEAVKNGRTGTVKNVRDDLRTLIKSVIFK